MSDLGLWSHSNSDFHLVKVVMVMFLFLELVAGALLAALFRPDMARSRSLGATVLPSFCS